MNDLAKCDSSRDHASECKHARKKSRVEWMSTFSAWTLKDRHRWHQNRCTKLVTHNSNSHQRFGSEFLHRVYFRMHSENRLTRNSENIGKLLSQANHSFHGLVFSSLWWRVFFRFWHRFKRVRLFQKFVGKKSILKSFQLWLLENDINGTCLTLFYLRLSWSLARVLNCMFPIV